MTDTILKELQGLNRPFKYVVTTIIMQKNGAGMDTGAAMHWDANKDGLVCIPWENGELAGRRVDTEMSLPPRAVSLNAYEKATPATLACKSQALASSAGAKCVPN